MAIRAHSRTEHRAPPALPAPAAGSARRPRVAGEVTVEVAGESGPDPVKLVRLAWMLVALLDETRAATLDEHGRSRLARAVHSSLVEVGSALPDDLVAELGALVVLPEGEPPTQDDLRVAEAQLVGWLRGLLRPTSP